MLFAADTFAFKYLLRYQLDTESHKIFEKQLSN